jgi:hypothetical protein
MPVGSTSGLWLLATSSILGTAGVFAQTLTDAPESSMIEKLGTAGLLVSGAFFLVRYFIGELAKKDQYIERMTKDNTDALLKELAAAHNSREQLAVALRELTDTIRRKD